MNPAIREWIQTNHQPWHGSPDKSMFRGVLGSEDALPLDAETREYFARRGVETNGRMFEELLEADLLAVVEKIALWMTDENRKKFDQAVAFGFGSTLEPNACAMTCLDGYAVLFDDSFHALLVEALDLYFVRIEETIQPDQFPLILNSGIATTFFHATDGLEYLARKPKVTHEQRQRIDRALWFVSLFFLGHEAGHILLGHFEDAPKRGAAFRSHPGLRTAEVLRPAHREEFAADRYSSELLFEGEERGELFTSGADRAQTWSANYGALGWVFSIFGAVERMSERLGIKLYDTHPPASKRWERIARALRRRAPILDPMIRHDEMLRTAAMEAAESGTMPEISKERLEAREGGVGLPSNELTKSVARRMYVDRLHDAVVSKPPDPLPMQVEEGTKRLPAREVLEAWFYSPSPRAAMEVLLSHPEMLNPRVVAMHHERAKAEPDEVMRRDILVNKLLLLCRCIEIGIEEAFNEYEAGKLGVRSNPLPAYDACSSSDPAVLAKVEEAVKKLVNANTARETEAILDGHPELQHPAADWFLGEFASEQPNESARKRVEAARIILAISKRFTVFRAVLEARARLRF
jgi:hypothetical protein